MKNVSDGDEYSTPGEEVHHPRRDVNEERRRALDDVGSVSERRGRREKKNAHTQCDRAERMHLNTQHIVRRALAVR
ncbi:hypothetical protein NECAME_02336 [Necator americanus]|uniref:Uncharacterized protein n=1 Tax=Necator americanus TaxID=51031 RepID=W2TG61_NECAM|nr:hypothetical protein NECAME_02336 [Necator americanus]ETN80589.1 hypothetical protein NECAME_02336 [Necator americanus]